MCELSFTFYILFNPKYFLQNWSHLISSILYKLIRLKHIPNSWKISEIMIPKSGKDHRGVESYRPIALLPIMSKLLEKLILKCLKKIIEKYHLVPTHQFGFHNNRLTMD